MSILLFSSALMSLWYFILWFWLGRTWLWRGIETVAPYSCKHAMNRRESWWCSVLQCTTNNPHSCIIMSFVYYKMEESFSSSTSQISSYDFVKPFLIQMCSIVKAKGETPLVASCVKERGDGKEKWLCDPPDPVFLVVPQWLLPGLFSTTDAEGILIHFDNILY